MLLSLVLADYANKNKEQKKIAKNEAFFRRIFINFLTFCYHLFSIHSLFAPIFIWLTYFHCCCFFIFMLTVQIHMLMLAQLAIWLTHLQMFKMFAIFFRRRNEMKIYINRCWLSRFVGWHSFVSEDISCQFYPAVTHFIWLRFIFSIPLS